MMNLAIFERMPRPGHETGTWGYLANAFVLAPYRNQGIGARLLDRAARPRRPPGLPPRRPSALRTRVPSYQRAGFTADGGFLIRYAPSS